MLLPYDSVCEGRIFATAVRLFSGCAVVPNVTLSHVVAPELARRFLGEPAARSLQSRHAELDLVVYGVETTLPILAVETDGPQPDAPPQAGRDRLTDTVCRVAGLPLVRVRIDERVSDSVLGHRLGRELHQAARSLLMGQRGHEELVAALSWLA